MSASSEESGGLSAGLALAWQGRAPAGAHAFTTAGPFPAAWHCLPAGPPSSLCPQERRGKRSQGPPIHAQHPQPTCQEASAMAAPRERGQTGPQCKHVPELRDTEDGLWEAASVDAPSGSPGGSLAPVLPDGRASLARPCGPRVLGRRSASCVQLPEQLAWVTSPEARPRPGHSRACGCPPRIVQGGCRENTHGRTPRGWRRPAPRTGVPVKGTNSSTAGTCCGLGVRRALLG